MIHNQKISSKEVHECTGNFQDLFCSSRIFSISELPFLHQKCLVPKLTIPANGSCFWSFQGNKKHRQEFLLLFAPAFDRILTILPIEWSWRWDSGQILLRKWTYFSIYRFLHVDWIIKWLLLVVTVLSLGELPF